MLQGMPVRAVSAAAALLLPVSILLVVGDETFELELLRVVGLAFCHGVAIGDAAFFVAGQFWGTVGIGFGGTGVMAVEVEEHVDDF